MEPIVVSIPRDKMLKGAEQQLERLQNVCHFIMNRAPRRKKGENFKVYIDRKRPYTDIWNTVVNLKREQLDLIRMLGGAK